MSQIFLLRHAKAVRAKPAMTDYDRPLDDEGHKSLDALAIAMRAVGSLPKRVVLSGSRRTRETAYGLLERLGVEIETIVDDTIYSGGTRDYLTAIHAHGDVNDLMLVGHNPSIEDLALRLCDRGDGQSLQHLHTGFPTAGLATISVDGPLNEVAFGSCVLKSFPLP
ncbi:histidine phosphatase family protein [Brucella sp. BE17]|uniref:SixA phosphatase family protein n=1 Tax=Brucella sp. BE17 TaxID=3142977 RepID=UPI0031BB19EB